MFNIPTTEQPSNLTKPLSISQFHYLCNKLSVINIPQSLKEDVDVSVVMTSDAVQPNMYIQGKKKMQSCRHVQENEIM